MLTVAVVSFALLMSFMFPVAGLAAYLLAITLGAKTLASSHVDTGPLSVANACLVASILRLSTPAISRVWHGRCRQPGVIYSLMWLLTVVVFVSGVLTRGFEDTAPIFDSLWFGPLLLALYQLDPPNARRFLLVVVGVSACIGGTAALLGVHNFGWLASHLQVQYQTVTMSASEETADARVILPGIWTIAPFGFWIAIGMLTAGGMSRLRQILLGTSLALILLGLMVNYSRSVAVPFILGPAVLVVIAVAFRREVNSRRLLTVMTSLLLVGVLCLAVRPTVRQNWSERFFGAQRSGTLNARLGASAFLYRDLQQNGEVLGEASLSLQNATRLGDPFAPLIVWHKLGFAGMVVFTLIALGVPLAALWRTLNSLRMHGRIGRAEVVTIGYSFYFAALLVSGLYFSKDMLFPLVVWQWIAREPLGAPDAAPLPVVAEVAPA